MLLQRVYRVFTRYADRTVALTRGGRALYDDQRRQVARVNGLWLEDNRLIVKGTADSDRVGVQFEDRQIWIAPAEGRFELDVPFEPGPLQILTERDGQTQPHAFAGFSPGRVALARVARAGVFIADLLRLVPAIWRWKRHGDLGAREIVKEGLRLVPKSRAIVLDPAVLEPTARFSCPHDSVTLVMPVYNAFETLKLALWRIEAHTDLEWRLILVDDASTEPGLSDWLSHWAGVTDRADRVHLLRNEQNLGFVGSVNRGLEHARQWPDAPVVLMNSDALVPAGWATRLLSPLADRGVASVTPLSNDAEIFTVPTQCRPHALLDGAGDALDGAAAQLGVSPAEAPTGVGFCMALAPRFLADLPTFDEAFGRGYGEETDWCQRARARGGRHVCATNLFVEHRGGTSFGSAAKQKLLARNGAEISRRYPRYDDEVQRFILNDPLGTARLALGLTWAATLRDEPVPVYLAHALGGGAENYLQSELAAHIAEGGAGLVLRVGQGRRWTLELYSAQGVLTGRTDDTALMRALVGRLPRRRLIYSCGVGDGDPVKLPDLILALAGQGPEALRGGAQSIEVLFHDFFPISPSYTLLDRHGHFRGLPRPDSDGAGDHRWVNGGAAVDLSDWQAAWGRLMGAASRVIVFSPSSQALVAAAYPQARDAIEVRPHAVSGDVPRISPPAPGSAFTIGVLGNIGPQKGAGVVQEMARAFAASQDARVVVIGHLAPEFTLAAPSRVHGAYRLTDLPGLVARYGIQAWLIPSIWPETFSFTTHEAIATGLPVFCFDLGAQGDAVRAAQARGAPCRALPLPDDERPDASELLAAIRSETAAMPRSTP
ncbi:MAG: glycosyltransferase [Pseudomonadota bacterium]